MFHSKDMDNTTHRDRTQPACIANFHGIEVIELQKMSHWQVRGDALLQITFTSLSEDGGASSPEGRGGCDDRSV